MNAKDAAILRSIRQAWYTRVHYKTARRLENAGLIRRVGKNESSYPEGLYLTQAGVDLLRVYEVHCVATEFMPHEGQDLSGVIARMAEEIARLRRRGL